MASRAIGDGLVRLGRRSHLQCPMVVYRASQAWRMFDFALLSHARRTPRRAYAARALDVVDHVEHVEHVSVPCASSGRIIVSLYNVPVHAPTTPLLLYLPPTPPQLYAEEAGVDEDSSLHLERIAVNLDHPPEFLLRQGFPVATIHYRWSTARGLEGRSSPADLVEDNAGTLGRAPSHLWPTPLHDVMFGYDWIKKHLAPPLAPSPRSPSHPHDSRRHHQRRDLYVYGSYLGSGLAAALALTETLPQQRVAIRGVATYNGIYNWTAYVDAEDGIPAADDAGAVNRITPGIPALGSLFSRPTDLFDSFASPTLFFRTAGHLLPPLDFDKEANRKQADVEEMREAAAEGASDAAETKRAAHTETLGRTRRVFLGFPHLHSPLSIPSALLLHTPEPEPGQAATDGKKARKPRTHDGATRGRPRKIPEAAHGSNSFARQADEMASLMCRGIEKVEMKRRQDTRPVLLPEYDRPAHEFINDDADVRSRESERRVRIAGVGAGGADGMELGGDGQQMLLAWLDEHMNGNTTG